jgi:hypothetical protein
MSMSSAELDSMQPITAIQFNPATLTGSFQEIKLGGIGENIKIMTVYNGGSVAIDISYDGTNLHAVWPAGSTLIVDFQTNHSCNPNYGAGTLNVRAGQRIFARTSVNPTWLTIGGYR